METEDFDEEIDKRFRRPIYSGAPEGNIDNEGNKDELTLQVNEILNEYNDLNERGVIASVKEKLKKELNCEVEQTEDGGNVLAVYINGEIAYKVASGRVNDLSSVFNSNQILDYGVAVNWIREKFREDYGGVTCKEKVEIDIGDRTLDLSLFLGEHTLIVPNTDRKDLKMSAVVFKSNRDKAFVISTKPLNFHGGMYMLLHEVGHKYVENWYKRNGYTDNPYIPARIRSTKRNSFSHTDGVYLLEDEKLANMFAINSYKHILETDGWSQDEIRGLELAFYVPYVEDMKKTFNLD